jgi:hypothetical protein
MMQPSVCRTLVECWAWDSWLERLQGVPTKVELDLHQLPGIGTVEACDLCSV